MSLVELLLDTARADTELLGVNAAHGDNFNVLRDIDFLLLAPDEAKAQLVRNFIDDNRYGVATVMPHGDSFGIVVVVNMAPQQNVLCSVSGLMACISMLFGISYDGWECDLKRRT